jgi:hypothetical protein
VSNQGGPYGAPQYPQQPQYQQYQQYQQQYPQQWPPPQPPKSRGGLIAALVIIGVVIVGLVAVFVVVKIGSGEDSAAQPHAPAAASTPARSGAPSTAPSGAPTVPTGPVSCGERTTFECFPVATVASVSKVLTAKGASCKKSKETREFNCGKGGQASYIQITLMPDINDAAKLGTFLVMTSSHVAGDNPTGRALVINNLKHSMPTLMAAVLPNEPKTRQDITAWLTKHAESCPPEAVTLDGYKVNCDAPTRFSVTDKQKLFTTYTFGLSVDAATAFMR